jgi:hypothetical protein
VRAPASFRRLGLGPRAALLALLLLGLGGAAASAARHAQGEHIQVTGIVSDRSGRPLEGLSVVLEVSRNTFSLRTFRREPKDVRRVSATTNAKGEYTLEWPWDAYFNHYELVAGIAVRKTQGKQTFEELAREDVTRRLDSASAGSPAVVSLVADNAQFVDTLRQFLAAIQSDDERRIYDEMGKPDKVERLLYPGYTEESWWYFESGRVYRFRAGHLEQVVPFTPVPGA